MLDALNDKETVHARAQSLGIPVPRQYDGVPPERYPVVIKPHCGEKFGLKAADRYAVADTPEAYAQILARMQRYDPAPIVQDRITGPGIGVSLLLGRDGRLICALCHRRIREYPVTGGPSTCCEAATAGSDAHLPEEIGNGVVTLEVDALTLPAVRAALLRGATAVDGRRGKARYVAESQLTKRRRTHAGAAAYAKWALFAAKCCLQDITWKEETYHVLDR